MEPVHHRNRLHQHCRTGLQGHVTTVTKTLERVDVSDCRTRTAEKGESSDLLEHGQQWRRYD